MDKKISSILLTKPFFFLLLSSVFYSFTLFQPSNSQPYIGINYGQLADNLPSPSATAKLLQSTTIQKLRLYNSDPTILKAFANTKIGITIGVSNNDIPSIASDPTTAKSWINTNIMPFYPASNIILITVGNEVLLSSDDNIKTGLVPAMKNLMSELDSAGIKGKIKISTVNAMTVLGSSDPPSSGKFDDSFGDLLKDQLGFLNQTGSPFAVNPYPFFAYQSDPRAETLAFCLFEDNPGRVDSGNNIKYMNMFDAQVDAVRAALNAMGFQGVEILVAETGWPYKGDSNEIGPSIENAKAYNGNLIKHLRSMVGTPLMPGKSIDTYIFALYDEDLKPGPASEKSFGLYNTDLTMTYDVGLTSSGTNQSTTTQSSPSPLSSSSPTQPGASSPTQPGASTPPTVSSMTPPTASSACLSKGDSKDCAISKTTSASPSSRNLSCLLFSVILQVIMGLSTLEDGVFPEILSTFKSMVVYTS